MRKTDQLNHRAVNIQNRIVLIIALFFSCNGFSKQADHDSISIVNNIEFIWQDEFTRDEKEKAKKWLRTVSVATQKLIGQYPFTLRFFIRRQEQSYAPLVGCRAKFGKSERGVYMGVDLRYPYKEFMESWKTPHEISHLALPGLGRQNAWFFEGFATFMSRQILTSMGHYKREELNDLYVGIFKEVEPDFRKEGTFLEVIRGMVQTHNYRAFYWGGATYFYRADRQLRKDYNTNMCELIKEYQKTERKDDRTILMVIKSWDRIIDDDLFSRIMREYRNKDSRFVMNRYNYLYP